MHTPRIALRSLTLGLLGILFVTSGCATKIAVRSMQPGRVNVGASKHLAILQGVGRRSAREVVFQELVNQCRMRGYFSVEDRSEDGFTVRIAGRRVTIDGPGTALEKNHAGVRVDVLEWNEFRDTDKVKTKAPDGKVVVKVIPVKRGNSLLAVTMFDARGRAFLAEREYQGVYTTNDMQASREEVLDHAAAFAVSQILDDITPTEVVNWVVLDTDDPGQKPIIQTAKAGNIALAADDTRRYLQQNPHNAGAAYNLGVYLNAMGEYGEALAMYDKAMTLGNKAFYSNSRAACARRMVAATALDSVEDQAPRGGGAYGGRNDMEAE